MRGMSTSLDEVLSAARAGVEARRKAAEELARTIERAAGDYVVAVEREALAELAEKVGLAADPAAIGGARASAEALRALVAKLPELAKAPGPKPSAKVASTAKATATVKASAPSKTSLASKLAVPEELRARVARGKEAPAEEPDDGVDLPLLSAASKRGRVVVLGGLAKDRLDRLKERFGFEAEWIETEHAGTHAVKKLEGRILDGRVAAVVVLDGLIGHAHFEPIARAARQTGTLLVYGDKAGRASLDQAFASAEAQLGKKKR
jgi:hypothetical protein